MAELPTELLAIVLEYNIGLLDSEESSLKKIIETRPEAVILSVKNHLRNSGRSIDGKVTEQDYLYINSYERSRWEVALLEKACIKDSWPLISLLKDSWAAGCYVVPLISLCIQSGSMQCLRILLPLTNVNKLWIDEDEDERCFLEKAVRSQNTEIVEYLLSQGADPNIKEGFPLAKAVENRYNRIVSILLKAGASVDKLEERLRIDLTRME